MGFILFSVEEIVRLHDEVINPGELQGLARGKSLEGALSRIDFRITYGVIQDEFDLAATYAIALAQGYVFNDANKRTAYMCMHTCLTLNHIRMTFSDDAAGGIIIKVAQGHMDESELATWLRMERIRELEKHEAK
jgi:death-on-curing protein